MSLILLALMLDIPHWKCALLNLTMIASNISNNDSIQSYETGSCHDYHVNPDTCGPWKATSYFRISSVTIAECELDICLFHEHVCRSVCIVHWFRFIDIWAHHVESPTLEKFIGLINFAERGVCCVTSLPSLWAETEGSVMAGWIQFTGGINLCFPFEGSACHIRLKPPD